jgi:prolyl-tRNA synthetase
MRYTQAFIPTLKEAPADAQITSHRLMIRGGMVRLLMAGVYSYLPLGWKVLRKIQAIIREEMERIGAQEFQLPTLNPIELWEETGRSADWGDDMFRLADRKKRPLCLAPTHEEVITGLARNEIRSYRELPQIWYQIQTKFRDEPRPRSGVVRARQFIMKDAYSFDATPEGLDKSFDLHVAAYQRIFKRCGLVTRMVGASSGLMGGSGSMEFMVESPAGEDTIAICDACGYLANSEVAVSRPAARQAWSITRQEVHTPDQRTIDQVAAFLKIGPERLIKSLVYYAQGKPLLVLVRGDHELNESKLQAYCKAPVRPAQPAEIEKLLGTEVGFIGPLGVPGDLHVVADSALKEPLGYAVGANKKDYHIQGVNPGTDFKVDAYADVRMVGAGEACAACGRPLRVSQAIELGHVFKLGTRYSAKMKAEFLDENGQQQPLIMGCYGIGVERIAVGVIEQYADKSGMKWPVAIAPYHVYVLPINVTDPEVMSTAEKIYNPLQERGHDVLLDDRDQSAGTKFKDAELLGIPVRVTIGQKGLKEGVVELNNRFSGAMVKVPVAEALAAIERELQTLVVNDPGH